MSRSSKGSLIGLAVIVAGTWAVRGWAAEELHALEEQAVRAAVQSVLPSIVRIEAVGGLEKVGDVLVGTGPTTGLVVSADGYIISSAFNFAQKPTSILVTLPGGASKVARIVARDRSRMLVLLKIDIDQPLPVPTSVPRDQMRVGQWATAVGWTYTDSHPNLSVGVISALSRIWGKAIQTDAKVSPANYGGPLVDIRGRVLGVLVPLAPEGQAEVAGAEWYDSGIGFAVPLVEIERQLPRLKQGDDLRSGLLGITLKGRNIYADPAVVAVSHPNSPAADAGLRPGDEVVQINGQAISCQSQLKHLLGPLYAGDTVELVVLRGEERLTRSLVLTDQLRPYEHPFLGVLPVRGLEPPQTVVRYVYPDSPADKAGLQAGDRITSLGDQPAADALALQEQIAALRPGESVEITIDRGGEERSWSVTLGALPSEIPPPLPPAHGPLDAAAGDARPATGLVPVKVPEEPAECSALVPDNYNPAVAWGLLVWLPPPGPLNLEQLSREWGELCRAHEVILLVPQSVDPRRWLPTEVGYVRKAMDQLAATYRLDPTRIVVHGYQGGAAMAYLVALSHRDRIRGVAAVDAALPVRASAPENQPHERLAVYTTLPSESPLVARIQAGIQQLKDARFPVTVRPMEGPGRTLSEAERGELMRWMDVLDRI